MPGEGHEHSARFERCLSDVKAKTPEGRDPDEYAHRVCYTSVGKGYGDGKLYFLGEAIEKEEYSPECTACQEMAAFVLKSMRAGLEKAAAKWSDEQPWYNDRITESFVSSEAVDKQGDSVAVDAVVETLPWLAKYGYYSWQHTDFPAGKIIGWAVRDEKPIIKVGWHDTAHSKIELHDQIWDYVKRNGYRGGSSIKGFPNIQKRVREAGKAGFVNRVEDLGLYHVAYTDSPANPDATMEAINTVAKAISKGMASPEPCTGCPDDDVRTKLAVWQKSARDIVEKYGGGTTDPRYMARNFRMTSAEAEQGRKRKMKVKKSSLVAIRDALKKELASPPDPAGSIDIGPGTMPPGRVKGEGVNAPGAPGTMPGRPVETVGEKPPAAGVSMPQANYGPKIAPTPGLSKDVDGTYGGQDPKVTGAPVDAPGSPTAPPKAEKPTTRTVMSDQQATIPRPATNQLSGAMPGPDVGATGEVDAPGVAKSVTEDIVGALFRSAVDMRGKGGVVYPAVVRQSLSKAGEAEYQDPGTMNQQPPAQTPPAAVPAEEPEEEGGEKELLIEILDLLQDLMPGTQEAAREVAEGAQELKERVAQEAPPEGAPPVPTQEPAQPEAAGAEAKGMAEETEIEKLKRENAELQKQVKALSKPATSPMSPVVDNTPGPAGRTGYGELREIVSKAAHGDKDAMADYWARARFVRTGERKVGNPVLPPIPNSELLSMEAKIKALSAGAHKA